MTKQEIVSVLSDLHKITGFRVSLHGADYGEIAAYPEKKSDFCRLIHEIPGEFEKCKECDKAACKRALTIKDTHIYVCRHGLTEAVSPLYNFGTLTGFLMMGQIFKSNHEHPLHSSIDRDHPLRRRIEDAAKSIPLVRSDMIKSYVTIMTICAQYLTLSNAIPSNKPSIAQMAKKYIHDNYSSKLLIKDICSGVGCSKSTLITAFKKEFGITVNNYINEVRLAEAERMITMGEKTIGDIAICTGFSDQSYFSKAFSAKFGIPPSEYKSRLED